jgi:bifunctional non-homologous end joining protein LigD
VRIYTRRGVDWTKRFRRITETVRKLKVDSILLDGERFISDDNGLAIFDKLHSKLHVLRSTCWKSQARTAAACG